MSQLKEPVAENRDHVQGGEKAVVTLVEYGDYECPSCGGAYAVIKDAQKRLGTKLRFVFRNFPLNDIHPMAELAAEAAEAAGGQGKFWEMHDALFENQDDLDEELVMRLAQELKLETKTFLSDLEKRKFKERVKHDFTTGVKSGVEGTPSFFINGELFTGDWSTGELFEALDR